MFDPFCDFKTLGYLHNIFKEKDLNIVKRLEHQHFKRNSKKALNYLAARKQISYSDFLKVHEILFSDLYPWAGQDRLQTTPELAISKGSILFCHPNEIEKYINESLRLGKNKNIIDKEPGEVIGLMAYGHPFLDGNGRTIILVHSELCNRAGFSIDWIKADKEDYLNALTQELDKPATCILDKYLLQFKTDALDLDALYEKIDAIKGLDGLDSKTRIEGDINSKEIQKQYQNYKNQRGYTISNGDGDGVGNKDGAKPK